MTLRRIQSFFGRQHNSSSNLPDPEISILAHHEQYPSCSDKLKLHSTLENSFSTVTTRKQSSVCFSTVQERRYNRILGDNPSCEWPLSLGWHWVEGGPIPLQQYELTNHEANPTYTDAKRYEALTAEERKLVLRRCTGLSESQIRLEERRRRMQLILEVFSSSSSKTSASACSVLPANAERLLVRYSCEQGYQIGK
jgi:hypothetical protein